MPKVTVLPVSTNNLQVSLFVDSSAYTPVIARYSIFVSVRQLRRQLTQKGHAQVVLHKTRKSVY